MRTLNLARTLQRQSIARRLVELQRERAAILRTFPIIDPVRRLRAGHPRWPNGLLTSDPIADVPDVFHHRLMTNNSIGGTTFHNSRRRGH